METKKEGCCEPVDISEDHDNYQGDVYIFYGKKDNNLQNYQSKSAK